MRKPTRGDIRVMEEAQATLADPEVSAAYRAAGLDIDGLLKVMRQAKTDAEETLRQADPWADAREIVEDIEDGDVPTREMAIRLATETRKMLTLLDGKKATERVYEGDWLK